MPDVFRCLRCEYSCAYLLPPARTRLRVHWAPGIPRALCVWRDKVECAARAFCAAGTRRRIHVALSRCRVFESWIQECATIWSMTLRFRAIGIRIEHAGFPADDLWLYASPLFPGETR